MQSKMNTSIRNLCDSLFMMGKEGLTREMEGRGGGEINLMLGFNYWVANLIRQFTLLDVQLSKN